MVIVGNLAGKVIAEPTTGDDKRTSPAMGTASDFMLAKQVNDCLNGD